MEIGHDDMKESRSIKRLVFSLIVVCACPWLTGCESVKDKTLTGRLWDGAAINHGEPAGKANLRLYQTMDHKDVLVRYDEELESSGAIKSRAFLLMANKRRLDAGLKPSFLSACDATKIQSTPLQTISSIGPNSPKGEEVQVMVSPDGHHFTLVSEGKEIGSYNLPTYVTTGSKLTRLALTPATVAGDITIYGALLGVFAAYAYAGAGLRWY
jgi:hypothetical protein